jgi:hypothetical protein
LRAVFLAVAVAMTWSSSVAFAAYQEVWNPPEAAAKQPVVRSHAKATHSVANPVHAVRSAHPVRSARSAVPAPMHVAARSGAKTTVDASVKTHAHASTHAVASAHGAGTNAHVAASGKTPSHLKLTQTAVHSTTVKPRPNFVATKATGAKPATVPLTSAQKSSRPAPRAQTPARAEPPIIS